MTRPTRLSEARASAENASALLDALKAERQARDRLKYAAGALLFLVALAGGLYGIAWLQRHGGVVWWL